jgi:hypothetical protein
MKLISILNEIVTREKKALGKGLNHKIYPHPTNPDLVYKVGQYHVMYEWVPIFKAHPDIFPKVYGDIKSNVITFKDSLGKKVKREASWILVEKLDAKTFNDFFEELDEIDYEIRPYSALFDVYLKGRYSDEVMAFLDIIKRVAPYMYDRCVELLDLVDKVLDVTSKSDFRFDLHANQFGYDKTGKLKCLDI